MADNGLNVGKTARVWMQWCDVAVADGRQSYEAEVEKVAGYGEIILQWPEAGEGVRYAQRYKAKQCGEDKPDIEVEQDRADDPVKRHVSRRKYRRATTMVSVTPKISQAVASRYMSPTERCHNRNKVVVTMSATAVRTPASATRLSDTMNTATTRTSPNAIAK